MNKILALAAGLLTLTAFSAFAEDTNGVDLTAPPAANGDIAPAELAGTLKKVRESGAITIGYREASFPFSYVANEGAAPIGYSIDLCQGVVDEIVRELNGAAVRIDYQLVTSDTRMEAVASGKVDLECGSTTGNIERQKTVAFSPVMFVAGTKLLAKRDSGVNSYRDLPGKVLVVTAGTTNETAMKLLNQKYKLGIKIISAPDHEQSYNLLADGKADAFATDDVLLYGFIARKKAEATMAVVGDFITYEAYGLMFRKDDPQMAAAVARAYSVMAQDGKLVATYHKWFLQATPSGENIDLPISLQLTEAWRALGVDDF
jgi:glutamate/aspartate transport system substrate-binding protein